MNKTIDGININYIVEGTNGSKVLLLHGWGANLTLFNNIIKCLSKNHIVYSLDMPGFGESGLPDKAWNVDDFVDFIIDFIKEMKIEKLSILGHSHGGRIIIKMASRKNLPFEIEKLILVDSAGIVHKRSLRKRLRIRTYKTLKYLVSNKLVSKFFPNALDKLKEHFGSADYKGSKPIMRESMVKVVNEDLTNLLPEIKKPTLIIWGTKDEDTPYSDAEVMEKLIPDSGIVKVEGAGHYSFLYNPVLVNSVLENFLS